MIEAVDVYGTVAQKLLGEMVRDLFFLPVGMFTRILFVSVLSRG